MRLYRCKIRLAGSVLNEVRRIATAAEIIIWRWLHGGDAVVEIQPTGRDSEISNVEERERLKSLYDPYLTREKGGRNPTSIDQIFGMNNPLPGELPNFDHSEFDSDDAERKKIEAQARREAHRQSTYRTRGPQTPPTGETEKIIPEVEIVS